MRANKYPRLILFGFLFILSHATSAQNGETSMITAEFAKHFAAEWIEAWNAHDLPRILSHYDDNFEMSSPLIRTLMNEPNGTLKGKDAIGAYWQLALSRQPLLHFTLEHILIGANSITLAYQGSRGLSTEVFHFNEAGTVTQSYAHYVLTEPASPSE